MGGEPVDAGHIHTGPSRQFGGSAWQPDMANCRAAVHDGGRWPGFHQCTRKVKVTREVNHHGKIVEMGYCKQHDPVAVKAKADAWRAKLDADCAERDAQRKAKRDAEDLARAAIAALRQIAAGHNDPRSLAIEVLAATPPTT